MCARECKFSHILHEPQLLLKKKKVLHFTLGVLWPFSGVPLPHDDSTSALAIGLVTDAERSVDIVPVSQTYVCYHFCLLHIYSSRLDSIVMITARGSPCAMIPVTDFCCLLLWFPLWIFFVIVFTEVTSDHRHKQRESQGLWPRELWIREDGAQQERSILI